MSATELKYPQSDIGAATATSPQEETKEGGIRLICAGLGRTGTLSLTEALSILGYKPYHYIDTKHSREWSDLAEGNENTTPGTLIDLIIKDGYDAVLENPTCDIYTNILERFPSAKVVLTVRDSPEKFEVSWKTLMETMAVTEVSFRWSFPSFFLWIPLFRRLKNLRRFLGTTHLGLQPGELAHGWRNKPEGWLADQYAKHNRHVIASVPANNLLVFNVKEGWEPLCDFLGLEIPSHTKFPHSTVNTKEALAKLKRTFEMAVFGWIPVTVLVATTGAFLVGGQRWQRR